MQKMKYLFCCLCLGFCGNSLFAQERISVKYISSPIHLDGKLDEPEWQNAEQGYGFWQFFPTDTARSVNSTVFRLLYDDRNLYIGVRADVKSENYVVSSLRRDFTDTGNDNVTFMFDTFKDGSTAFLFGMTPYGVQREAFVSGGGSNERDINTSWDQKWLLESTMYDDHYILEAVIPLSSIKFREGETSWRLQCYRWDMQTNEQSAWIRVPQNQLLNSLAFMAEMTFEKPLGKSRTPFAIIPYINTQLSEDFVTPSKGSKFLVGGDAKVAIGNSMNLDVTVNPDFSNVEVDGIFTNLTRFEVFLPERRQFFIDNNDLFGNYGDMYNTYRPFFSRRIGLAMDTSGNLIENRIMGGVRLSGKINEDLRLGVLNIQTVEDAGNQIPSNNNMMISVQRKVFSRSNIGIFGINREATGRYDYLSSSNRYNRVIGVDYDMASADNTWIGKFFLHKSFQPDDTKGNLTGGITFSRNKRKFTYSNYTMYVDEDFKSDLGFVPRTGFFVLGNRANLKFYPKSGIISQHGPVLGVLFQWSPPLDFKLTEQVHDIAWHFDFRNQSRLRILWQVEDIYLLDDFDPTRSGGVPLPGHNRYAFTNGRMTYTTNPAKILLFNTRIEGGQFFTGSNFSTTTGLNYRLQPWGVLGLETGFDHIRLPEPHATSNYWRITPRADITFSKNLYWSTLVQYSNQRDNLGINSRLQWRFAPLSDLYLVYNDNYFTNDRFMPKFRSINLKFTYWLNL